MTLAEKQAAMIDQINALGDCFDQYGYLIVKAGELPAMPPERKTSEALVPGCQSRVWLHVWRAGDRVRFEADSDTLLLRGVLQLLRELLDGASAREAAALPIRLFQDTELAATFTSDRGTGVQSILKKIQSCPS